MTVPAYAPAAPPAGWWRTHPDSSGLTKPHPYVVVFVPLDDVDRHAQSWADVLALPLHARLPVPDRGLVVITVGHIAVIGATEQALAAVGHVRTVVLVPDLDEAMSRFPAAGITIETGPFPVAVGRSVYVTTADGSFCEWVEHRPRPSEQAGHSPLGS